MPACAWGVDAPECAISKPDGVYPVVVCELDSIDMRNLRAPSSAFILGMVGNLDRVGLMLKFVKGGVNAVVWLDSGTIRMCGKYGIRPERFMRAALRREIHARAESNLDWLNDQLTLDFGGEE